MTAPVLQFKRGNAGVAGTIPALRPGEPGFSLNNFDLFVGFDTSVSGNKFFGSHRYWGREDGTTSLRLKLVDRNGTNSINIKSPDTLVGTGTYTLPDTSTISDGYFLKVASDGTLSWDTVGGTNGTFTNPTFTGLTTITGSLDVTADSSFSGITTISNVEITGGTIDGTVIGGTTPSEGYFTLVDTDILVSDNSTLGIATATDFHIDTTKVLYDDGAGITLAGIQTIDATTKQTLEDILAIEPNDFDNLNVSGIATVGGLIDGNGGADISGQTDLESLNVSIAATFASAAVSDLTSGRIVLAGVGGELEDNANLTFDGTSLTIGTGVGVTQFSSSVSTGTSTSSVPTSSAVIDYVATQINQIDQDDDLNIAGDTGSGTVDLDTQSLTIAGTENEIVTSANNQTITIGLPDNIIVGGGLTVTGAFTANGSLTLGDTSGDTVTVKGTATFEQTITGTATTANTVSITDTDAQSGGILFGSAGTGSTLYNDTDLTYDSNTNILSVPILSATTEVRTGSVKAADGTASLTISNTSGAVTTSNDLTVQGNLYVNGSTTQVNTNTLEVEDRTIELGRIQTGQPTTTTWDLAVLFNYGDGAAKKAGVVWEASGATKRFQFTTDVTAGADGGPTDTNLPSFTVANFAPIEISELWVNNTCTGGAQQVISCVNSELQLQNIVVDAGTF